MMREAKGKQIYLIESDGITEHNHILKMTQKGKTCSGHHLNQSRLKRGQKFHYHIQKEASARGPISLSEGWLSMYKWHRLTTETGRKI